MSEKDMKKFYNELKTNEQFRENLKENLSFLTEQKLNEMSFQDKTLLIEEKVLSFVRQHNLNITLDDIVKYYINNGEQTQKLNEDILLDIAGGASPRFFAGVLLAAQALALLTPFQSYKAASTDTVNAGSSESIVQKFDEQSMNCKDLLSLLKDKKDFPEISDKSPYNEIDALVFASLSYLPMNMVPKLGSERNYITIKAFADLSLRLYSGEDMTSLPEYSHDDDHNLKVYLSASSIYAKRIELLKYVRECQRYKNIKIGDFNSRYVPNLKDNDYEQFAAVTFSLENNDKIVAFRGTDGTLSGWKEDVDLLWSEEVPAQKNSKEYLHTICSQYKNSGIFVTGHSKGGHLAIYSALKLSQEKPEEIKKIQNILNFDGPGLRADIVQKNKSAFESVCGKITTFVPQTSLIGIVMSNLTLCKYECVSSTKSGFMQHDSFTWEINTECFKNNEKKFKSNIISTESKFFKEAMENIIDSADKESLKIFSDQLFKFLESHNLRMGNLTDPKQIIKTLVYKHIIEGTSILDTLSLIVSPGKSIKLSSKDLASLKKLLYGSVSSFASSYLSQYSEINKSMGIPFEVTKAIDDLKDSNYSMDGFLSAAKTIILKIFCIESLEKFIKNIL